MNTIKQQILNTISNHIDKQTTKGIKTYGQSLDDCPVDKYDWQNMIIEELIDALQYQQKQMSQYRGGKKMNVMAESIKMWAKERNLDVANPHKQMLKVGEEFGELCQAIAKDKNDTEIKEEIGDIYVTLVILCTQLRYDIDDCIDLAYEKIKDRKGKTINGIYIKDEDL